MAKSNARKMLSSFVILLILAGVSISEIRIVDASNGESVKIMPLGDSITQGITTDIADPVGYRQRLYLDLTNAGFNVDFVGSLSNGSSAVPPFDTDHEGHRGWHTGQIGLNVYGWLEANPADIVLLHIGTNDVTDGDEDVAEVEGVLNEIDRYESDYSNNITVILARIILRGDSKNTQTIAFNDDVENMARLRIADGDDIIVVDLENALTYPDDLADFVHPTPEGYEKMVDVWYDAILQVLMPSYLVVRGANNSAYYRSYNGSWDSWTKLPGSTIDSPAAAVLKRTVITSTATTIWSDGFEEGNFLKWSQEAEDAGCSVDVVTTDPQNGSYHASFSTTGDRSAYLRKNFGEVPSSAYVSAYVKPKDQDNGALAWVLGFRRNLLTVAAVRWDTDGFWSLCYRDGGAWNYAASSVKATNDVWYRLELYHESGSGDGEDKLWVNGALEVSKTGLDNDDRGNPEYVSVGKIFGTDDGDPVVYVDSVTMVLETTTTATTYTPTLHTVVRGNGGNTLWHGNVNLTDGSFSGWIRISGATPSAPTLASDGSSLYLVVRGGNDRIYYNVWSGSWSGWTSISGSTTDSPAAAVLDGALHIVVRGNGGNSLWHGYVNLSDSSFTGWTKITGSTPSAPTLASDGSKLYLVVRGGNDRIYYNVWNDGWGDWTPISSGSTTTSPAATVFDGALHIVVRGKNVNTLYQGSVNFTDSSFTGWTKITGQTPSAPTLTS